MNFTINYLRINVPHPTISHRSSVGLLQALIAPIRKAMKKMLELNFGLYTQQLVLVRLQGLSSSFSRALSALLYHHIPFMWLDFKQTEIQGMLNQGTQGKSIWASFQLLFQLQTKLTIHSSKTYFTSASFPHPPPTPCHLLQQLLDESLLLGWKLRNNTQY